MKLYKTLEQVQGELRKEGKTASMTNAVLRFAKKPLKDEPYEHNGMGEGNHYPAD